MKVFTVISIFILAISAYFQNNQPDLSDELKITRAVRLAVREADSTLLHAPKLTPWRNYLKIAALNLDEHLQPLVLIKFDEDISFRNQLKTIIEWEANWKKKETEHYIYYYRWDQPPPEIILEVQDAHFNEIANKFQIEAPEKIPYRYDLNVEESKVYPYEDLRGGIVSPQPFDLQKGALAIFYLINSEPPFLLEPLARIYGSYYQNPSTARAYYVMCLNEIRKNGYIPAETLFPKDSFDSSPTQEWYSSYAFVYDLDQEFGPAKIAQFLARVNSRMAVGEFELAFEETFGIGLPEYESRFKVGGAAVKM
jgi:hypothetical protein